MFLLVFRLSAALSACRIIRGSRSGSKVRYQRRGVFTKAKVGLYKILFETFHGQVNDEGEWDGYGVTLNRKGDIARCG